MALHTLLARQARYRPDHVALVCGAERLTWSELEVRVGDLVHALGATGLRPGDAIATMADNAVAIVEVYLAAAHGGFVVVPLSPLLRGDGLVSLVNDSGAKVLVTMSRLAPVVDGLRDRLTGVVDGGWVLVDGSADGWVGYRDLVADRPDVLPSPVDVGDGAPYNIIYSSGTTGDPKGIVHTHRSAVAYAEAAARTYELSTAARLANVASLHFDQSTFELYAAPLVGASVVVVPDAVLRFPASVADLVEREQVTVWYSVPYVLRQLVTRGALPGRRLALRWILFGGEPYPPDELAELMALVPGARVSNVYGPAEVNQCTFHHLDRPPDPARPVPIGRAWSAAEVVVVDPDTHPPVVSPATGDGRRTGELLVATPTMMRGYWGRPELTRSAIVEASFPGHTATRWYRTGDLVVEDGGGLVFAGRLDHQVKLRGQRVELEAVEAALCEVPGVRDAAAVVDRSTGGEPRLVGVVVTDHGIDERAVRTALRAALPAAAVPEVLAVTDVIPRSSNGKLDRAGVLSRLGRTVPSPVDPHSSRTADHTDLP